MRRIVVSEFVTLDGVVEAPNEWSMPYWNDDIGDFKYEELFAADALLLGRTTYEGFAAAWPAMEDGAGFAEKMNSMPKYVVSSTLREASWENTAILSGDLPDEVAKLHREVDGVILVAGSACLVQGLLEHDLVDELRLMVFPVLLGEGKRLFGAVSEKKGLRLADSTTLGDGIALLTYGRAG